MCLFIFEQYPVLRQYSVRGEQAAKHHAKLIQGAFNAFKLDEVAVDACVFEVMAIVFIAVGLAQLFFHTLRQTWGIVNIYLCGVDALCCYQAL